MFTWLYAITLISHQTISIYFLQTMFSELSHYQRAFIQDIKEFSDPDTHTFAYYFPFQSPRMSRVFILDVVDSLLVGGTIKGAEVFMSRIDLMAFIPYGYKFDEKLDQINHWFLVVKIT